MTLAWVTGGVDQIRNNLMFAGSVYASWLSDAISKRFALDPSDQLQLFIISYFYYQSLFKDTSTFDEETKQMFAVHTIKASKAPSKMVFEIFDKIGTLSTMEDYCTNVKNILDNVRLKDLNAGLLITTLGNSWYGINSKEILAIALEHPPTWVAIVYTALVERTFKNSTIARIAERFGKNGNASDFLKAYVSLTQRYLDANYANESFNKDSITFKPFE